MGPHKSAAVQAAVPVALGIAGLVTLGEFHWGIFIMILVLAAFAYHSGYSRAKYGAPPVKSLLFGDMPGKPPHH